MNTALATQPGPDPSTLIPLDPAPRDAGWLVGLESLTLLVFGIALMTYFYAASTPKAGAEIGVPEHDSFYHIKMAAMLPQVGLVGEFPWLQYAWFRNQGTDFVSHHYGFHVLLMPFVYASKWLVGDFLPGGRWAMAFAFGLNLLLFNLLLRTGQVRWRWLWIVLFLLMPDQFFSRHAYVRAIGPSFALLQLLLLMLFRQRYVWAGLTLAAYVHLYLGAVPYGPVIVAAYTAAILLARSSENHIPWRMLGWCVAGWAIGLITYPYFWIPRPDPSGVFEFLKMQILDTGLGADIEVGREWRPYTDAWFFFAMSGTLLTVWTGALVVRLARGPTLDARALTLILLNFAFLVLTAKSRRFIEYWPPICLLSAAYLLAPAAEWLRAWWEGLNRKPVLERIAANVVVAGILIVALILALVAIKSILGNPLAHARPAVVSLLADWQLWTFLTALALFVPLVRVWIRVDMRRTSAPWLSAAIPVGGAIVIAVLAFLAYHMSGGRWPGDIHLSIPVLAWSMLLAAYLSAPLRIWLFYNGGDQRSTLRPLATSAILCLAAVTTCTGLIAGAAPHFAAISRDARCRYDLDDIRAVHNFIRDNSKPGEIIFTDDWDIFPVDFYHNSHNHYIVGLDPKFTHKRDPALWERFVKISRGEAPIKSNVKIRDKSGAEPTVPVDIRLEDIRDHFHAGFVITDRDHKSLAGALARASEFARLVYPGADYAKFRDAPYLVFQILGAGGTPATQAIPQPDLHGNLYLGQLRPVSVEQGWGTLRVDRSVEGRALKVAGKAYGRGLGTHAPAKLLFDVPPGFDWFEAEVGVDDETGGSGSVASAVALDGKTVFRSPTLHGGDPPVVIRIPLQGARQILLEATPADDGQRFDHVNWLNARFVRSKSAGTQPATASKPAEQP